MVVAAGDHLAATSPWRPTSARTKKVVLLPGGQFDATPRTSTLPVRPPHDGFLEHLALSQTAGGYRCPDMKPVR
jgi:hypothetical protein